MVHRKSFFTIIALMGLLASIGAIHPVYADTYQVVTKIVESFDHPRWLASPDNKAPAAILGIDEHAPDAARVGSMRTEVTFDGDGFAWSSVLPPAPIVIPGNAKTMTLRFRINDNRYPLRLNFADGWGREKADGKDLLWDIPLDKLEVAAGKWVTKRFTVPADWVRPISIVGFSTHNWNAQKVKTVLSFDVNQLEVSTDLTDVDPATGSLTTWTAEPNPKDQAKAFKTCPTTPLLSIDFTTGVEGNVFNTEAPSIQAQLRNWHPGLLKGTMTSVLRDDAGAKVDTLSRDVEVDSLATVDVPLKIEKYGRYSVQLDLVFGGGIKKSQTMILAKLPPTRELTEAQKLTSPYGLNVHSGARTVIDPFKKAGIVWFREYSFQFDWLLRAKGWDGHYAGWPYYPRIVKAFDDAKVKLLPVLQHSITRPSVKDGKIDGPIGPNPQWTREIASVVMAFPQITHWELSNEYDLDRNTAAAEELCDWGNYQAYHKRFAEILHLLGDGKDVAVENGRAGIFPQRVKDCIASGAFGGIGVVNSHHYCGVEAPEINYLNFNTGFDAAGAMRSPSMFFDELRETKRNAQSDGKNREHWLTEFGWDTLAGPIVTPYQQAVYLPRAWMIAMAAGTDKAFWFYNFDAKRPHAFFDGCGLMDADSQPKLSLSSLAGMAYLLPQPKFIGDLYAGPDTQGYVFECDGKRIAAIWSISSDQGPSVAFDHVELFDFLGNRLPGNSAKLTMAPVYAVGVSTSDPFYLQTAFSLESRHLTAAVPGDIVKPLIKVFNNRSSAIDAEMKLVLPNGWTANVVSGKAAVAPGQATDVQLAFTVPVTQAFGLVEAKVVVTESGKPIKEIPFHILVQQGLMLYVSSLPGTPGKSEVAIHVGNRAARDMDGSVKIDLPKSWHADSDHFDLKGVKSNEVRIIKTQIEWNSRWNHDETAKVILDGGPLGVIERAVIPGEYRIPHAGRIKLDGTMDGWPAAAQIPDWMLGSTVGEPDAHLFMAWAQEGLYVTVKVANSKISVNDPKTFWGCDALELFIDTANNKNQWEFAAGDHQFWFVPQIEAGGVYAGQWKVKNEIPETRYAIPGVTGISRKDATGYMMQFLLPAAQMQDYRPHNGSVMGVNLNITVQGPVFSREVYWPRAKDWSVNNQPHHWGTLELGE